MHRDFLGNTLNVDDEVVTTPKGYRGLVKAVVVAFTAQQVRVKYINTWNYGQPGKEELFLTYGSSIIKVPKGPSVEQKLEIETLIAKHEDFDAEYGVSYMTVEKIKEEFLPDVLKVLSPK